MGARGGGGYSPTWGLRKGILKEIVLELSYFKASPKSSRIPLWKPLACQSPICTFLLNTDSKMLMELGYGRFCASFHLKLNVSTQQLHTSKLKAGLSVSWEWWISVVLCPPRPPQSVSLQLVWQLFHLKPHWSLESLISTKPHWRE